MPSFLLTAVLSYLLGSIPFGYLLVRIFHGEDVRQSGSGNIGATNVSRKSPALGALTLLLDAVKGSAAVAIGMLLSPPALLGTLLSDAPWYHNLSLPTNPFTATWAAVAALFAILGHIFPIWLRFRGGKGVATGLGSFLLIAPKAVLLGAGIFLVVVLAFRYVSLGSIIAVAAFPLLAWLLHEYGNSWLALAFMSLASLLIMARHRQNIRRLLAGTENRFRLRRAARPKSRPDQPRPEQP
jgi:acyl phosphate:glycerol-3-phosphate acyltransferase